MAIPFDDLTVPLREDPHGVVRVGGTRVTLDTVVSAFHQGATPEEMVQNFSTLKLDDVYAVIAFYLRNRPAVEAYLQEQQRRGEEARRHCEATYDRANLRERLLARRQQTG